MVGRCGRMDQAGGRGEDKAATSLKAAETYCSELGRLRQGPRQLAASFILREQIRAGLSERSLVIARQPLGSLRQFRERAMPVAITVVLYSDGR